MVKRHEILLTKNTIEMDIEKVFKQVLDCAFKVHSELGPGLLESAYEECFKYELIQSGLQVERQKALPLVYKEVKLDAGYRIDLLVENSIIVELKSVEKVKNIHKKQLLTYLRLADKPLGLLINFNEELVKDGITRIINSPRDKMPLQESI